MFSLWEQQIWIMLRCAKFPQKPRPGNFVIAERAETKGLLAHEMPRDERFQLADSATRLTLTALCSGRTSHGNRPAEAQ
jgi:hypothetical protein